MEADWDVSSDVLRAELSQATDAAGGFQEWKSLSNTLWSPQYFQLPTTDFPSVYDMVPAHLKPPNNRTHSSLHAFFLVVLHFSSMHVVVLQLQFSGVVLQLLVQNSTRTA
jgi:hypothetical protein